MGGDLPTRASSCYRVVTPVRSVGASLGRPPATYSARGERLHLILLVLFLASCLVPPPASVSSGTASPAVSLVATGPAEDPRRVYDLARGFKFRFGVEASGVEAVDFHDRSWPEVDVPHTWNAADGTSAAPRRGVGWYRLRFHAPPETGHARAYLRFSGVSIVSTVWVNGRELGTHWGANSAFCYDVTDALRSDTDNVLVVRADTTWRDDVPPREGDFTIFGGIYRAVSLIFASPVSIDLLDHASPGVFLTTPEVTSERGTLRARVRVRNATRAAVAATVAVTLLDETGRVVRRAEAVHASPPGTTEASIDLTVDKPRLWQGRADPFLYTAAVEVAAGGVVVDRVRQHLGFRTFRVDPERGFLLNGRPYDLHGANLHQDRDGVGWAMSPREREQDFDLLREIGATFVRLVHYQHDQQAYDLADRLGLVVWAEHGLVGSVSDDPLFAERAALQLTELIRQSYNHPSIVAWGIGNEVQPQKMPAAPRLLERLAALVRSEDPSRPSTLATCFDEPAGSYGVDLIAHNKYFGWYGGALSDFSTWLDAQRSKSPAGSMGMSEYGAGAGVGLHSSSARAMDHTEEYQSLFHETYWRALRVRPWVWCKAVWQMFDTASSSRHEGEHPGINDKGLVTRDRKVRKDAFYWYKANWSDDRFVHLTGKRFTPRSEGQTEVKVYSSCDEAELWQNGRSLGVQHVDDHIARWSNVELSPGENRIDVTGRCRGENIEVRDSCVWTVGP
jgi:beta-galactosidase